MLKLKFNPCYNITTMKQHYTNTLLIKLHWSILFFVLLCSTSTNSFSQTLLIDPAGGGGFNIGNTFASNGWTIANSTAVNQLVVGSSTTLGMTAPFAGNKAYVSNDLGLTNSYTVGVIAVNYFYRDVTIPAGQPFLNYSFTWVCNGESIWDMIQLFVAPTTVVPAGTVTYPGSGLNTTSLVGATFVNAYNLQSTVQTASGYIIGTPGTTVRIIFCWKDDGSGGTMPGGSIDNISLTSVATLPTTSATAAGGLWSSPATWVGGVVPAGNNVSIPSGSSVTVDQIVNVNNLTIDGIVQWNGTTNPMTLAGNLTINPTGSFLPYTAVATPLGQTVNIAGNFTNNGYANCSLGTGTQCLINFNGSGSVLGGSGIFEGDGTRGFIRQLFFQSAGSSSITTTQPLTIISFAHTAGTLNTNGKLRIDNTVQVFGRPVNTQVSSISVTNMGSLYNAAPIAFGTSVSHWVSGGVATANTRYYSAGNVYLCTTAGTFGASAPANISPLTETNGTATLLWIGTQGTLGTPFQVTAVTLGTQYFCGDNLYTCIASGTPLASSPPTCIGAGSTCVSGTATFRYAGSPAKVNVNYDATTQTLRSLSITNPGSGYSSATAPALIFSVGIPGGTGSGAVAFPVIMYNNFGPASSLTQKSGGATITGGITINSDQNAATSGNPQASSGIGGVSTTGGGVNYTVAPQIAFGGPSALNLITNPGSGYTAAPTITVSGGNIVTGSAYTSGSFTITVNQGTVESVYLSSNTAIYSVPPTLTMSAPGSGTTATLEFPAGCWPAATASIGDNGQLLNFTITNPGFGYVTAPPLAIGTISGTAQGGTFSSVATAPSARVALYNLTLNFFSPSTVAVVSPDDAAIPSNRKMNNLTLNGNGNGLNLTGGNLTLFGQSPFVMVASLSSPGNILNLMGNNLLFTWNAFAGATNSTFNTSGNCYIKNGSITLTGRGGAGTFNYPFAGSGTTGNLVWFVGSTPTANSTGCNATKFTVTELGAPTNSVFGTGVGIGNRSYRAQLNPGALSGTNPTVTLNFNSLDGLTSSQDQTFVSESSAQTGPWTIRSTPYGASGALPAAGIKATATVAPGPISGAADSYFAFSGLATTVNSISPSSGCGGASVVITGSGFTGTTAVTFGGTPALSFVVNSGTQITAVVSNAGSTGPVSVASTLGTGTSPGNFTFTGIGPIVSIQEGSAIAICPSTSQTLTALPTGNGETYLWSTGQTTQSISVSAGGTYTCTITSLNGCANLATSVITISGIPSVLPSADPSTICSGNTSQLNAGTFVAGTLSTPFNQNNGSTATGFDITNISVVPVTLHFFSFQSSATAGTVGLQSVYYSTAPMNCVHPTNVTTAPGWVLIGSVNTTSAGTVLGVPTVIPLDVNITIPAGATYAFAVGGVLGQSYTGTGGSNGCPIIGTTPHLQVREGFGGTLTGTIVGRAWNGTVTYNYGDPNLSYLWSPSTGLNSTTILNPISSVTTTTTYTITATNAAGCSSSASTTLTVNPTPAVPTVSGPSTVCGMATVTLTSSAPLAGNTINWYDASTGGNLLGTGTTFNTPVITGNTTFYAQQTGVLCSSARVPKLLTWSAPPTFAIFNDANNSTSNATFCGTTGVPVVGLNANTSSAASWAANGSTYSWSQSNPGGLSCVGICAATNSVNLNNIIPAQNNEHIIVTVSDPLTGCVSSDFIDVTAFTFPNFNASALPPAVCTGQSTTISAGISSTTFAVSPIAFAGMPLPGSGVTTLSSGGSVITTQTTGTLDDGIWATQPIGFNFNFFGNSYSTVNISTNGNLQFSTQNTTFTPGSLPTTTITNFVAPFWTDLYPVLPVTPGYGIIRHWTSGFAPNRVFVVEYENVGHYNAATTPTAYFSGQVWLYETTGIVEVHISSIYGNGSPNTYTWSTGVNNLSGTIGAAAPNRNNNQSGAFLNATNESWRFSPPVNYTFAWTSTPSGFTASTGSAAVSPAVNTQYNVLVTDPITGCIKNDQVTVNVNPLPTVSASPASSNVCYPGGTPSELTASGSAATYAWSPASGLDVTSGSTVNALPPIGTVYTVTATNSFGCTATATTSVSVTAAPTVTISSTPSSVCYGANAQLNATAISSGYTMNTNCGTGFIDISATGVSVGTLADDNSNLITIPSFTFNGIAYTSAIVGTNGVIVFGNNTAGVTLSNTTLPTTTIASGNSFLAPFWDDLDINLAIASIRYQTVGSVFIIQYNTIDHNNNSAGMNTITFQVQMNLLTGVITFVYTDVEFNDASINNGLSATVGIQLSSTSAMQYSVNTASLVNGQCISFTPVTPVVNYNWSANSTFLTSTSIANPIAQAVTSSQVYSLLVTDQSTGCMQTQTYNLNVLPLPVPAASSNAPVCENSDIVLTASDGANYSWTGPDGFSYSSTIGDATLPGAQLNNSGNYTVQVVGLNGCTNSETIFVQVNDNPEPFQASMTPVGCSGANTGSFQVGVNGGTPFFSFFESITQVQNFSGTYTGLVDGTYYVDVTDLNQCISQTPLEVIVTTVPNAPPVIVCPANVVTNNTTGTCGAIVNYATPVGSDVCPIQGTIQTNGLASGSSFPIGTTVNTFVVTDVFNATATCSFTVTVSDSELPTIVNCPANFSSCNPISWVPPTITDNCLGLQVSSTNTPGSNFGPGNTIVTYTAIDAYNNVSTCSFTVTRLEESVAATGITTNRDFNNICSGDNITLTVDGGTLGTGANWKWYTGTCGGVALPAFSGMSSITVSPTVTTTYFVRAEGQCNTTGCASVLVEVSTSPPAGVTVTTMPAYGAVGVTGVITCTPAPGATFYRWTSNLGHINAVWFNGAPGPVETSSNSVTASFQLAQQNYQIRVVAGNACGRSNTASAHIRGTVPASTCLSGPILACPNTNATYSVAACPIPGTNDYQWSVTGNATITSGQGTPTITVHFNPGFTNAVVCVNGVTNFGLAGPQTCLNVSTNTAAPGAISGNNAPCQSGTENYSVVLDPAATSYLWTTNIIGATASGTTNTGTVQFPAGPFSGLVCVQAISGCGTSVATCYTVTSGAAGTPGPVTGPVAGICGASNINYALSTNDANTYNWILPAGVSLVGGGNANSVNVNFAPGLIGNQTITVQAIYNCGTSASSIVVNGAPAVPTITPATICMGQDELYFASSAGADNYSFTTTGADYEECTNGAIPCSQYFVIWSNTGGTMSVTASNTCGTSAPFAMGTNCRISSNGIMDTKVYPNPTDGKLTIEFTSYAGGQYNLTITDMTGRTILREDVKALSGLNQHFINLETTNPGMYVLYLKDAQGDISVHKITVE